MLVTLTNDFHNSSVTLRAEAEPCSYLPETRLIVHLTEFQTRKASKKLCGISGCRCSFNDAGTRGAQFADDGKIIYIVTPNLVS